MGIRKTPLKKEPFNPTINAELRRISEGLPKMVKTGVSTYTRYRGHHLLAAGIKKAADNKPILPNSFYLLEGEELVDHYKNIRSIYGRFGMAGVHEYQTKIVDKAIRGASKNLPNPEPEPEKEDELPPDLRGM